MIILITFVTHHYLIPSWMHSSVTKPSAVLQSELLCFPQNLAMPRPRPLAHSSIFFNPPSSIYTLEHAELWEQMDKYIENVYQNTSSDEEEDPIAAVEEEPRGAEEEEQLIGD